MKLLNYLFAKHDEKIRQQERDRLLALAGGDVRGCDGLDCEECERMILLDNLQLFREHWGYDD